MTTQLRLVDAPVPAPRKASVKAKPKAQRAARTAQPARRAANWGEWRLDARTRRVGREGIAAARRALEDAQVAGRLSRAS